MSLSSVETGVENSFRELNLNETLIAAIESSGYTTPTPIQARTIPLLLEGRDVLGQAQTGTGKTAAFALPLIQRMDLSVNKPQVLVLTPTRELAIQVAESFEKYAAGTRGLRVAAIYGGQDYQLQFRQLDRGVHVIVGTPGRVMDHMRRDSLSLDGLRCLVLDEADEMLRMGFAEDVEWILEKSPQERQIALFSATLPEPIRRIAQKHLRNPAEITIKQKTATADTIRQRFVIAPPHQKESVLGRILESESTDGVIVFVKMKSTTEPLAEFLNQCGHRAAALNGDVAQKQRERIIENLRAGRIDIVVATDVAARGLDVQRISHVINYDLPFDSEAYVHRIGRTGRAGRSGEAILFVHPRERRSLKRLEDATRQPIQPMEVPSNRVINKQRVSKYHGKITEMMEHAEFERYASIVEQYRQANPEIPIEKIAAALAVMSNNGVPLLLTEEIRQTTFADTRTGDRRDRRDGRPGDRGNDRGGRSDRFGRGERGERGGRSEDAGRGERRRPTSQRAEEGMETFRLEVGHAHQVKPGNIVGAIANETGLESSFIGRINIFDDYSTVDLPEGMPKEILQSLRRTWVVGQQLNISRLNERPARSPYKGASEDRPAPNREGGKGEGAKGEGAKGSSEGGPPAKARKSFKKKQKAKEEALS